MGEEFEAVDPYFHDVVEEREQRSKWERHDKERDEAELDDHFKVLVEQGEIGPAEQIVVLAPSGHVGVALHASVPDVGQDAWKMKRPWQLEFS